MPRPSAQEPGAWLKVSRLQRLQGLSQERIVLLIMDSLVLLNPVTGHFFDDDISICGASLTKMTISRELPVISSQVETLCSNCRDSDHHKIDRQNVAETRVKMSDKIIGETSLSLLLASLRLSIHPATFVFLTFPPSASQPPETLYQQMAFQEKEGSTIISTLESAKEHRLDYTFTSRMITCELHSSLEAVGFMAALTKRLSERGIGANPVSGFYHDHLFVSAGDADRAVKLLEGMAKEPAESASPTDH